VSGGCVVGASDAGSSLSPHAESASAAATPVIATALRNRRDLDALPGSRFLSSALADVRVDDAALAVPERRKHQVARLELRTADRA
jgi:hypothetical protein